MTVDVEGFIEQIHGMKRGLTQFSIAQVSSPISTDSTHTGSQWEMMGVKQVVHNRMIMVFARIVQLVNGKESF